jgi:hypothetical protein
MGRIPGDVCTITEGDAEAVTKPPLEPVAV